MSGSWNNQRALAAGQDQIDAERERMRALGRFTKNALRQLRGDHPFFGNTYTGEAQYTPTAQAGDLQNQRYARSWRNGSADGKGVGLLVGDCLICYRGDRLFQLINQRRAGVKTQALINDIVAQWCGKSHQRVVISQR